MILLYTVLSMTLADEPKPLWYLITTTKGREIHAETYREEGGQLKFTRTNGSSANVPLDWVKEITPQYNSFGTADGPLFGVAKVKHDQEELARKAKENLQQALRAKEERLKKLEEELAASKADAERARTEARVSTPLAAYSSVGNSSEAEGSSSARSTARTTARTGTRTAPREDPEDDKSIKELRARSPSGKYSATGLALHVGPRGGVYHYSASGKKVYHKRK